MLVRGGLVLALALLVVQAECSHWAAQRSILQTNNNNNNNGGWFPIFRNDGWHAQYPTCPAQA